MHANRFARPETLRRAARRTLAAALAATLVLAVPIGCDDGSDAPEAPFDWCDRDAPPDEACFATKRAPQSQNIALALEIARAQIAREPAEKVQWRWEDGVMMIGFADLYRVTGEADLLDYMTAWIDHHVAKGYDILSSDTCPPAAVAALLYARTGDAAARQVVEDVLRYLYEVAARTEDGGINHLGELTGLGVTLWVDSLFMFGTTLIRWGQQQDDAAALDEFANQYRVFATHLQDGTGWFLHAYQWLAEHEDVHWSRGNSWVTAAAFEYLRARKVRGEADAEVGASIRRQVDAIVATQDAATGLWWTIPDGPELPGNYLETSGAALFAYGMARGWRIGELDDAVLPVIARAMDGVRARITRDVADRPVVTGTSGPTTAGTLDQYLKVGQADDIAYGIGAVLLALIETSGLPEAP